MSGPGADRVAFCRRAHPRLVGTLSQYCGDAVIEELAQETLYRACRDWSAVRGMPARGTWVLTLREQLADPLAPEVHDVP